MANDIGRVGVWARFDQLLNDPDPGAAAAELEALGYGAVWIGGATPEHLFDLAATLLDATERLTVASGILNIRTFSPEVAVAGLTRTEQRFPGRFVTGLGVGHSEFAAALGVEYTAPLPAARAYLDALDVAATGGAVLPRRRVLAALGPRMLELARDRADGVHPYFTTPAHTRTARAAVGPDALVVPDQKFVPTTDADVARATVREAAGFYFGLTNYASAFKRIGFTDDDLTDGGSDRLIDALVAWGGPDNVAARVREHLDAGATQVAVQAVRTGQAAPGLPMDAYRELAPALGELLKN